MIEGRVLQGPSCGYQPQRGLAAGWCADEKSKRFSSSSPSRIQVTDFGQTVLEFQQISSFWCGPRKKTRRPNISVIIGVFTLQHSLDALG